MGSGVFGCLDGHSRALVVVPVFLETRNWYQSDNKPVTCRKPNTKLAVSWVGAGIL